MGEARGRCFRFGRAGFRIYAASGFTVPTLPDSALQGAAAAAGRQSRVVSCGIFFGSPKRGLEEYLRRVRWVLVFTCVCLFTHK
jgi:hypothetical protein